MNLTRDQLISLLEGKLPEVEGVHVLAELRALPESASFGLNAQGNISVTGDGNAIGDYNNILIFKGEAQIEQEVAQILAKFSDVLEHSVTKLSRQISELRSQTLPPVDEQRTLAGESKTNANGSDVSVDDDPALRHEIVNFLRKLRDFGLDQCVVFRPEEIAREDLRDFCLPARVLTEDEYNLLDRERQSPRDPAIEEPDYIFPTNDIFWRRTDGRLFATPKLLNRVLESSRRHVILRGVSAIM